MLNDQEQIIWHSHGRGQWIGFVGSIQTGSGETATQTLLTCQRQLLDKEGGNRVGAFHCRPGHDTSVGHIQSGTAACR